MPSPQARLSAADDLEVIYSAEGDEDLELLQVAAFDRDVKNERVDYEAQLGPAHRQLVEEVFEPG